LLKAKEGRIEKPQARVVIVMVEEEEELAEKGLIA
tara:strand:+ start:215 stop:319 length:105 start_codon:yes stop_codon:yes gene_type:complete